MNYAITINLKNAATNDFKQLSTDMQKHSFSPVSEKQVNDYALYNYSGSLPIKDIINRVASVVTKAGKQYSFTVMKSKP